MKLNVAVIGASGFVGDACCHIFRDQNVIKIDPRLGTKVEDLLTQPVDLAMICVPTPMGENGVINSSIVESVLDVLKDKTDCLIALKSTVLPDIVAKYESIPNFVYNPEFLTEKNARSDAENPTHTVIGGSKENCEKMKGYYEQYSSCAPAPFFYMTPREASFVKYGINSFLALKVAFFNQYADQCAKLGADYDVVRYAIGEDPRIGVGHTTTPGHDGRKGFGSACFSKDVPAIVHMTNNELSILREAWNVNCDIRNSYGDPLDREVEQHIVFNKI